MIDNKERTIEMTEYEDDIDLVEILLAIWKGKWLIIILTIALSIPAVIYAIKLPNIYKADAILAPSEVEQGGGLSSIAGQFGGLASLAGVNLNSGSSNKSKMAIEILRSRKFISQFVVEHNILPALMAAESWDRDSNKIVYDDDLYDESNSRWVRKHKPYLKPKPSLQEAYKAFTKIFHVSEDTETSMISISIEHVSPQLAKQWVDWLVLDINKFMKVKDVSEAQRSIEYLSKQVDETSFTDIKGVLYKLVEEQVKIIMFANVRDEYVYKTVDPALVSEERFKPNRALISIIGAFIGMSIGLVVVLARYFSRSSKN